LQIFISFKTNNLNLPLSYNQMLQGFIFRTLEKSDSKYSEGLHNSGKDENKNLPKLFCFGRLIGHYYRRGKNIIFPSYALLEIRCPDIVFIEKFISGCTVGEEVQLGKYNKVIIDSICVSDRIITESTFTARTVSPFAIHTTANARKEFNPDTVRNKLLNNAMYKWEVYGNSIDDFSLDIKWTSRKPKPTHAVFDKTNIASWETDFILSGNSNTLNFIYNTGIGARNSQGFGLFEKI